MDQHDLLVLYFSECKAHSLGHQYSVLQSTARFSVFFSHCGQEQLEVCEEMSGEKCSRQMVWLGDVLKGLAEQSPTSSSSYQPH